MIDVLQPTGNSGDPSGDHYIQGVAKVRFSLTNGFISPNCSKPAENLVFERKTCRNELKTRIGLLCNDPHSGSHCYQWAAVLINPGLTATNQVYQLLINFINLVYQHVNIRNSTKPGFSVGLLSVYLRF
jgi:hypothetical protein